MRRATRSTSSKVSRTYSSPFCIFISCHGLFQTYKSYSDNWIFFTQPRAIQLLEYLMFRIRLFVGSSRKECIFEIIDKYIMDTCIVHYIHQRQIIYTSDHFYQGHTAECRKDGVKQAQCTYHWILDQDSWCLLYRNPEAEALARIWLEGGAQGAFGLLVYTC